jgi:hypothetical protein
LCVVRIKENRNRKNHEKKKQKVNLILSHVKHTFLILDFGIGPYAFKHIHTLGQNVFFNLKKGPIQGSIDFKLVPRFLVLGSLFKMALTTIVPWWL